jgi:hypothetical protein
MKIPNIPFINPKKDSEPHVKSKPIRTTPDQNRIQRELDYESRLGKRSSRQKRLQDRIDAQKRRSYGR